MSDVLEVDIRGVFVDHATDTAVVLLGELATTNRVLPIVIGPAEAQAIAIGISVVDVPRPLTHDLLLRTVEAASGYIRRVDVVGLAQGTFLAELELALGDRVVRIDARPSDCIALAVRAGVPIGVDRDLFDRASVGIEERHEGGGLDEERIDEIMRDFRRFLDDADPGDFRVGRDRGDSDEPDAPE